MEIIVLSKKESKRQLEELRSKCLITPREMNEAILCSAESILLNGLIDELFKDFIKEFSDRSPSDLGDSIKQV